MIRSTGTIRGLAGMVMVAVVLAASCGDDPAEPPASPEENEAPGVAPVETVSFDAWVETINDLCVDTREAAAGISAPETPEEVEPALDMAADSAMQLTAGIRAAGTPDRHVIEAATYIDLSWQAADVLAGARDTAATDPVAALDETEALEVIGPQADRVARDLGLSDCYEDEPTGDAEILDITEPVSGVDEETDGVIRNLEASGFTTAEAACLAERIDELNAAGGDPDALVNLFLECGIGVERLAELGG